jgi:hypothetical protein
VDSTGELIVDGEDAGLEWFDGCKGDFVSTDSGVSGAGSRGCWLRGPQGPRGGFPVSLSSESDLSGLTTMKICLGLLASLSSVAMT